MSLKVENQKITHICLLGATGSVGDSTLKILEQYPHRFHLESIAFHSNWEKALPIIQKFQVKKVCVFDEKAYQSLKLKVSIPILQGLDGLIELASDSKTDLVINALLGSIGCLPTLKAIETNKTIGLANKETMVMGGEIIQQKLKKYPQSKIIPIDSEHSAIFQCLHNHSKTEVTNLQLTASGGPFLNTPSKKMSQITVKEALKHPTWSMGKKISIDSATMMNKGLEVIEAHYLFEIDYPSINIVVHPSSLVHSLVQFHDGSLMAHLGSADMQIPILYSLTHPKRLPLKVKVLDLTTIGTLNFSKPDFKKFPCLNLAYEAGRQKGCMPAVLNASNEIAVLQFLAGKIHFLEIPKKIERCLQAQTFSKNPSLQEILAADQWAREYTLKQ